MSGGADDTENGGTHKGQLTRARESAEVAKCVTAQRSPSARGMSTFGQEIKFGCRGSNGRLDCC